MESNKGYILVTDHKNIILHKRDRYGRKAYRHFKDEIINLDVDEEYYAYRFLALCKIAKEWCEDNEIPYTAREEKNK